MYILKKNNSGFVIVETVAVSLVVLTILVVFYASFNLVMSKSKEDAYYDNIEDIYRIRACINAVDRNSLGDSFKSIKNSVSNLIYSDIATSYEFYYLKSGTPITSIIDNRSSFYKYLETLNINNNSYFIVSYSINGKDYFASLEDFFVEAS